MNKGDQVKITRDSSKCGVLSKYIGSVGTIDKVNKVSGHEIAEVIVEDRILYIQTKYLTKI